MIVSPPVEGYHLKSELARVCLSDPRGHSHRTLAWVNSLCLFFLLIGIVGARSTLSNIKPVAPPDEPVPILIQPLAPTAPPQSAEKHQEQPADDASAAPRVII